MIMIFNPLFAGQGEMSQKNNFSFNIMVWNKEIFLDFN